MKDDKIIKMYVKAVLHELNCSKAMASVFRQKFLSEISDFAEENEEMSYETLVNRFGQPAEIAAGFFNRSDYEELLKKAKKKARIGIWIGIGAAILAAIAAGLCIYIIQKLGGTVTVSDAF